MLKRTIVGGTALALLSTATLGVPLWSYARCGATYLTQSASEAMPIEWEIKRARQMIADLDPEIQGNAKQIAREKIETRRLRTQVEETRDRLSKAEQDIERLRDDLAGGQDYYTYAGRTYTSVQVKNDLSERFKRFKTRKETAQKLEDMLSAREQILSAAHNRMDAMMAAKRELEVEIENLQARLGAMRVAEASHGFSFDDSHLAQTRNLLDEIHTRLDVIEETQAVDIEYFGEIELDEEKNVDILDEVAAYFDGEPTTDAEALVAIQLD